MARLTATGEPGACGRQAGFSFLGLLFLLAGMGVGRGARGTSWHNAAQRAKENDQLVIGVH